MISNFNIFDDITKKKKKQIVMRLSHLTGQHLSVFNTSARQVDSSVKGSRVKIHFQMNFPVVFLTLLFLHVLDVLTQTHSAAAAVDFSCTALKLDGKK